MGNCLIMTIRIDGTNTTANPGITGADADTGLQFGTNEIELVTGGTNRATVESNGNLTIEDGNLVVAAGHGIDFSATSDASGMSSELLDDYEEGTWTATLIGATTAPTTPVTKTARYTKVGRIVTVGATFSGVDTTGASGHMRITGLPFAVVNTMQGRAYSVAALSVFSMTDAYGIARVETGTSEIRFFKSDTVFGSLSITAGTGRYVAFSLSYEAA